ncbi:adenylyltransferase and sulfurtransferase MOCS3 isoform X2 [Ischnura elegans]|uniref:adenylyltransferase and sulfurtransferase MOCS3 isoform X2 n=1 Tax=Ischnura elegans TaxID=197161 RepID=UPI001ED89295|nr:adenylyltransferase and sulfurtransferase MOCS3 isoform X2 [Ischnura elegans]
MDKLNSEATKGFGKNDVERYCRQMILPEIGTTGQAVLRNSSVLIVGCGGIGCPVALYLAAAGVGRLGLVDYDDVELSNLHRQVLHTEVTVGVPKVDSAAEALQRLNMDLEISRHNELIEPSNVFDIIKPYDVVVDATDNVPTRYLLNDACWLAGKKPLVSGSALKMEGQLTVYGGARDTEEGAPQPPCYRCLFPTPPPVEAISNCSDSGVLGVVPGLIGILQALEVIKILMGKLKSQERGKKKCYSNDSSLAKKLLLFDAATCSFRSVRLRSADPNCPLCGTNPTITSLGGMDYENLCGVRVHNEAQSIELLKENERISVHDYNKILKEETKHVLLDVRSQAEFDMCHLSSAVSLPMSELTRAPEVVKEAAKSSKTDKLPVYVFCRRGNDSQRAVKKFQELFGEDWVIKDIKGGLHEWSEEIDPTFPHY